MEKYWTEQLKKAGKPVFAARFQKDVYTLGEAEISAAARRLKRKTKRGQDKAE